MSAKIKDGELIITLPVEPARRSSAGKTILIATTRGVLRTTARFRGRTVSIVAKAFINPDRESEELAERRRVETGWCELLDRKTLEG